MPKGRISYYMEHFACFPTNDRAELSDIKKTFGQVTKCLRLCVLGTQF